MPEYAWPILSPAHSLALRQAVNFVQTRFSSVSGVLVSGSIVRGQGDARSDLDIYLIHQEPYRQRLQRRFGETAVEFFLNPPSQVERYFNQDRARGRLVTAHMLGTGLIMLDLHGELQRLQQLAHQELARPLQLTQEQLTQARYFAALQFEDALDLRSRDPERSRMVLLSAVDAMLSYAFLERGLGLPRPKELLDAAEALQPGLGELSREICRAPLLEEALALGGQLAQNTIRTQGFFEWESSRLDASDK